MKIELVTHANQTRIYLEAPLGTNANSMRALARKKMNATPCPDYVDSVTGKTRPGAWAQHLGTSAEWKVCAPHKEPAKRLFWTLVVIPDWSAEKCA